jgi:hypothetical protein
VETQIDVGKTTARSTTEINSKNSLYHHRHFNEHLVGAFRKSPRESDLNHESSSLLNRRLKNHTGISLQRFTQEFHRKFTTWTDIKTGSA